MKEEHQELLVADDVAWQRWLAEHHGDNAAIWLVLAKKGTHEPTSLVYAEALETALCYGWVDSQLQRRDATTFRRRFSPRRPGGAWSKRNVALVERLVREGRICPAGEAAIERAKADGSWDAAYAGQASIEVPDDLAVALAAEPSAKATFEALDRVNRYAVLYRVETAKRPETRARRMAQLVDMLARGETIHPPRGR